MNQTTYNSLKAFIWGTSEQVFLFGGYMNCFDNNDESKENVGRALDVLSSKGLLTIYEYSEGEKTLAVYCLSPYCNSCMRKDSIASHECMSIIANNRVEDVEYVEAILSEYCDEQNGVYSSSTIKVEAKLDSAWDAANPKSSFKLEYNTRDQALRQYSNRLSLMLTWVEHINSANNKSINTKRLGILRSEIVTLVQTVLKETSWRGTKNANILAWVLPQLLQYGVTLNRFFVTTIVKPDGDPQYEKFKELHFRQYADIAEARLRQQTDIIYAQTEAQKTVEEKIEQKVFFIKALQVDVELIAETETDPEVKEELINLAEKIRFSDPVSSDALAEIETAIVENTRELKTAENKLAVIAAISTLISERNKKVKILK